jgi:transposase
MEATIFTGWIYDHLKPHAAAAKGAHPLMLRAIAAAKKKNDSIDAGKIADCLRCDFLPECYLAATEIRERRRTLRYRHLLVRQMVQMKSRVSGLLMETGVSHNKQRLHKVGYFPELLANADAVSTSIRPLLQLSRESITRLQRTEGAIIRSLERDPLLAERVRRLQTIPAVWQGHSTELGIGDGGHFTFSIDPTGHQLLRAPRSGLQSGRGLFPLVYLSDRQNANSR